MEMPSKPSCRQALVDVTLCKLLYARKVAERRHDVVECKGCVVDRRGLDVIRPPRNEWNAYAALVTLTLQSLQLAVASEEFGVSTSLFVRTIVGGKEDDGVLVKPFSRSLSKISPTYWSRRFIMAAKWAWVWVTEL